ncbi:gag-pol polyprotein [Gossypium australe]|uniref:Gag-pol polyprotein n=1 Tax=Gossypium australe TaxID=47621 RepID=A0A5B6UTA7_9ROSI|nr:gag-pol polyprotein [Gossypium australe]
MAKERCQTVTSLINHCEFVKELTKYLDFLCFAKDNFSRMYEVCQMFYHPEEHDKSLTSYFMDFKRVYEELNVLFPFSSNVKVQQSQQEQMAIMSFFSSLPLEFKAAKSQILLGFEISSLQNAFTRTLQTENTYFSQT